jgi:SpoVK/Ycf46/Vps4 family AAA+-type ATPase
MGELVSLSEYRKRKEEEKHKEDMEEIRALQEQLSEYLDELGGPTTGPFISEAERKSWADRALSSMISALDGYSTWPIDSSDL